ncbi:hypothetical protein ACE1OE_12175 [Vibrio sp. E150_011]
MNKLLLSAMIASASASAFAQPHLSAEQNLDIINKEMSHLEQQTADVGLFVVTEQSANFETIQYVGTLEENFTERYISSDQAKEMNLEKIKKFHVYSAINPNQISKNIIKHIERDQPKYFSVDFYQNTVGNSDMVEFVAKVIEYK